jgi:nitroimidazol reductase NimA-like FMN-containing flavoprotein (pyridoxamine 5'-phosphate oxidase superfamily)
MEEPAIGILNARRTMAISTVRPDGWPQTTIVGYANEGWTLHFVIFRRSQKFTNIAHDDRVSVAIGEEPADIREAKAVFASGRAKEVTNPSEREHAWRVLASRHPNLVGRTMQDAAVAAIMSVDCEHVSALDYTKGLGHADALHLSGQGPI